MAYCTPEDAQYLAERGFDRSSDGQAFRKHIQGDVPSRCIIYISPGWEGQKPGNLYVPPPDKVFWMVTVGRPGSVDGVKDPEVEPVVEFADQQPTPTTAYVTAEIRGWKRQQ